MKYFFTISLLFCIAIRSMAQYGQPDPNFDADGILTLHINDSSSAAFAINVQPDNKILIAGYAFKNNSKGFALVRVYPDGSLDQSFGNGGIVVTEFSSGDDIAKSMKIQTDGKIILGGLANTGKTFAIARYNTDGSLDNTFSGDGKDTAGVGFASDWGPALLLQNNGKIDIVGTDQHDSGLYCSIVQYTTSGNIDNSFNFDNMSLSASINSAALQSDGKIVAGGIVGPNGASGYDFIVARFNTDGTIDNSFSFDGKVTTDFLYQDDIYKVAMQTDGKILATGYCYSGAYWEVPLARYMPDGTLDNQFAGNGKFNYVPPDDNPLATYSVLEQPDHKILLAGDEYDSSLHMDMIVFRLNEDGTFDSTFGTNGISLQPFQYNSYVNDMAIQSDGMILTCGADVPKNGYFDMIVMRLTSGYQPPSAITTTKLKSSVTIYPNPFSGEFTVHNTDNEKNTRFEIFTMDARLMYSCKLAGPEQSVYPGNLPSGTYVARIIGTEKTYTQMIVKR